MDKKTFVVFGMLALLALSGSLPADSLSDNPVAATQRDTGGSSWTSTANANDAQDNLYARSTMMSPYFFTDYLYTYRYDHITGYSAEEAGVPDGARIEGIQLWVRKYADRPGVYDRTVGIADEFYPNAGPIIATKRSAEQWPVGIANAAWTSYGGPNDMWGTNWNYHNIQKTFLGVLIAANSTTSGAKAYVDAFNLTVYFTPAYLPRIAPFNMTPSDPDVNTVTSSITCNAGPINSSFNDPSWLTYDWTANGNNRGCHERVLYNSQAWAYCPAISSWCCTNFDQGDVFTCTATPNTEYAAGTARSAGVTVRNPVPTVSQPTITPYPNITENTIAVYCHNNGVYDPLNRTMQITYDFKKYRRDTGAIINIGSAGNHTVNCDCRNLFFPGESCTSWYTGDRIFCIMRVRYREGINEGNYLTIDVTSNTTLVADATPWTDKPTVVANPSGDTAMVHWASPNSTWAEDQTLTCRNGTMYSPGGMPAFSYDWEVDQYPPSAFAAWGGGFGQTANLPVLNRYSWGDCYRCEITPKTLTCRNDTYVEMVGLPVYSDPICVRGQYPDAPPAPTITPLIGNKSTTFNSNAATSVLRDTTAGNTLSIYYVFYINGSIVDQNSTSRSYNCTSHARCTVNSTVSVRAYAYDRNGGTLSASSALAQVLAPGTHTPPGKPSTPAITPTSGNRSTVFSSSGGFAIDLEGNPINYSYIFYINNTFDQNTSSLSYDCNTHARCTVGSNLTVRVQAKDIDGWSVLSDASAPALITANVGVGHPPNMPQTPSISPLTGNKSSTFTSSAGNATDAENDPITYHYVFYINGSWVQDSTSRFFYCSSYASCMPGSYITVRVYGSDMHGDGQISNESEAAYVLSTAINCLGQTCEFSGNCCAQAPFCTRKGGIVVDPPEIAGKEAGREGAGLSSLEIGGSAQFKDIIPDPNESTNGTCRACVPTNYRGCTRSTDCCSSLNVCRFGRCTTNVSIEPFLPNYIPSIDNAPANLSVGAAFSLSITTYNDGDARTTNRSITRVRFGNVSRNFSVIGLFMGGSQTNYTNINCTSPGMTLLNMTVDYTNNVSEMSELDNDVQAQVNCTGIANVSRPDYVIDLLRATPANPALGASFMVTFSTKNNGTVNATNASTTILSFPGNANYSYYLSSGLPANRSSTSGTSFTCFVPGANLLNVTVDRYNNITESNESNNVAQITVVCGTFLPDYTVAVSAPPRVAANRTFIAAVNTTNIGNVNSTFASITNISNYPGHEITVPGLSIGESNLYDLPVYCGWSGARAFQVGADVGNAISELNESNNNASFTTECMDKPDYGLTVTAPGVVAAYTNFTVEIEMTNNGTNALPGDVSVTNASFLGVNMSYPHPVGLATYESEVWAWDFSCSAPGNQTLIVQTAAPSISGDYYLPNNLAVLTVNCEIPDEPDYMAGCTAPHVVRYGRNFTFNYTTRNVGGRSANNTSTTRVYFITNAAILDSVPALSAGQERARTAQFNCGREGDQTVQVTADVYGNVSEWDETNNAYECPVSCGTVDYIPVPDVLASVNAGVPFTIDANTTNIGTVSGADSFTYVEAGPGLSNETPVPGLAAHEVYGKQMSFTCTSPGTATIRVIADYYGTSGESGVYQDNNEWTVDISCLAADYVIRAPSSVSGYIGTPFEVEINTTNNGPGIGPVATKTHYEFAGTHVGDVDVPPLAALATFQKNVTFNCDETGTFILDIAADSQHQVIESNENNNAYAVTVNCNRQPTTALVCSRSQFDSTLLVAGIGGVAMAIVIALAYMGGQVLQNARFITWAKSEAFQVMASLAVAGFVLWALFVMCDVRIAEIKQMLGVPMPEIYMPYQTHNIYNGSMIYLENLGAATLGNVASLRFNLAAYEIRTSYQQFECGPRCLYTLSSVMVSVFGGETLKLAITNNLLTVANVAHLSVLFEYFVLLYIIKGLFIEFLPLAIIIRSVPFMRQLGGALIGIFVAIYLLYPAMLVANAFIVPGLTQNAGGASIVEHGTGCSGINVFGPGSVNCVAGDVKESDLQSTAGLSRESMDKIAPSDLAASVRFNTLIFVTAIFLPALNFIVVAAFARDLSRFLGEESDISRLGHMV